MTSGEKIKAAREKAKKTQADVARELGTTYQTISQWELGLRNPKLKTLDKIANVLECSVLDLMDDEDVQIIARSFRILCEGRG